MWRKAMKALSVNLCAYVPGSEMDSRPSPGKQVEKVSGLSANSEKKDTTENFCAICRTTINTGQAFFTAECSHIFHFKCIGLNVKHGNHVCPICRAKWKEVPFHGSQNSDHSHGRARVRPVNVPHDQDYTMIIRPPYRDSSRRKANLASLYQSSEPASFDDDEPLNLQSNTTKETRHGCADKVEMKTELEYSAIPKSAIEENFAVLIHLKAPRADTEHIPGKTTRAPVDLVTVLDISGSMAGSKLALLKRAMGFVIQNLGPSDRLSVIAFSVTGRRLFNLRRMTESGRQLALQAVNSLVASGGTNIADGLRKGVKVIEERKEKNPVCSIILLSDGQDIYNIAGSSSPSQTEYRSLLPPPFWDKTDNQIPVHAFGFGSDHDAAALHFIAETTGGTFSFIEAEKVIQDAFAQCIGGLLSVLVQKLHVVVDCVHPGVQLTDVKCGSYSSQMASDKRRGSINVGDLYADEERDFLVYVNVPEAHHEDATALLRLCCFYQDAVSNESMHLKTQEVLLQRPETVREQKMSLDVDRQRNRIFAAEAMAAARAAAERNALAEAVSILENHRKMVSESAAANAGDQMCLALDAEMREIQERMANRQRYESSGRAYVLSGLSSHSWQRATARGDSTQSSTSVHAYQTPSMVEMIGRSQILQTKPHHRR
ncbi:Zinc finger RING/FYVE/PHD-type protein [Dioscorea alata]|uniref:Zinc finger RING/FYVE/PHD-type protein n=1 Tax=Dioscorea alata TaxID=55571 RepID=A0ACB7UPU7_DIOAL|nr:Zinc finger RING/FYVE/PHD-type protein [Dioscorea alata]